MSGDQGSFVYIATTQGPVGIRNLDLEDVDSSVYHTSYVASPIAQAFNNFVDLARSTLVTELGRSLPRVGVVMTVDGTIDGGESWQLGALLAMALKAEGSFVGDPAAAAHVLWVTGRLSGDRRQAVPVAGLEAKLARSATLFEDLAARGTPCTLVLPAAMLDELARTGVPAGVSVRGIHAVAELTTLPGLAAPISPVVPMLPDDRVSEVRPPSPPIAPPHDREASTEDATPDTPRPGWRWVAVAGAVALLGGASAYGWVGGAFDRLAASPPPTPIPVTPSPAAPLKSAPASAPASASSASTPTPSLPASPALQAALPPRPPTISLLAERSATGVSCRALAFARANGGDDRVMTEPVPLRFEDERATVTVTDACALILRLTPAEGEGAPTHVAVLPEAGEPLRSGRRPLTAPEDLRLPAPAEPLTLAILTAATPITDSTAPDVARRTVTIRGR